MSEISQAAVSSQEKLPQTRGGMTRKQPIADLRRRFCRLCNFETRRVDIWEYHVFGLAHQAALNGRMANDDVGKTIQVTGAPLDWDTSRIFRYFSEYGDVFDVVAVRAGDPTGFFIVEFVHELNAVTVQSRRHALDGFPIKIRWCQSREDWDTAPLPCDAARNGNGGIDEHQLFLAVRRAPSPMEQLQILVRSVELTDEDRQPLRDLQSCVMRWLKDLLPAAVVRLLRGADTKFVLKGSPVEIFVDCPDGTAKAAGRAIKAKIVAEKEECSLSVIEDRLAIRLLHTGLCGGTAITVRTDGSEFYGRETDLLRFYSALDLRLRYLVIALLWWARREQITHCDLDASPDKLSEVDFIWLVISSMLGSSADSGVRLPTVADYLSGNGAPLRMHSDLPPEGLILRFFRFVATTDFAKITVSPRSGQVVPQRRRSSPLDLEHPLDTEINMTHYFSQKGLDRLTAKAKAYQDVFSIFDPLKDQNGQSLKPVFRVPTFPMLHLMFGFGTAESVVKMKGVPKRVLESGKTYQSNLSLLMTKYFPVGQFNKSDVNDSIGSNPDEATCGEWCNVVRETLLRILKEALRFEVRDVTNFARPKASALSNDGSGDVSKFLVDYNALANHLGIDTDKSWVPKEFQEAKSNDVSLGVFYVQSFWRTWERRRRFRSELLDLSVDGFVENNDRWGSAGAWDAKRTPRSTSLPFLELETAVADLVIKSYGPSEKPNVPLSSFLVEIRRKQDPTRIFVSFTDVASRSRTLKSICNFLRKFIPDAVAERLKELNFASSAVSGLKSGSESTDENSMDVDYEATDDVFAPATFTGEAEVPREKLTENGEGNPTATEGRGCKPSRMYRYNTYSTTVPSASAKAAASYGNVDDDDVYDPTKVAPRHVFYPGLLEEEFEVEATIGESPVMETKAIFVGALETTGCQETEDSDVIREIIEEDSDDLDEEEECEIIDVYDVKMMERRGSPAAVKQLFNDDDGDYGDIGMYRCERDASCATVKLRDRFSPAPGGGFRHVQQELYYERERQHLQRISPHLPRPQMTGMDTQQRQSLILRGWEVENKVNEQLNRPVPQLAAAAGETAVQRKKFDSGSSSAGSDIAKPSPPHPSSVPALATSRSPSPEPSEAKRRKVASESDAKTAQEGTFFGSFLLRHEQKSVAPVFPFLDSQKQADVLPLLDKDSESPTAPKSVESKDDVVDIENDKAVMPDIEIVEEISPSRKTSNDEDAVLFGEGTAGRGRRKTPSFSGPIPFL